MHPVVTFLKRLFDIGEIPESLDESKEEKEQEKKQKVSPPVSKKSSYARPLTVEHIEMYLKSKGIDTVTVIKRDRQIWLSTVDKGMIPTKFSRPSEMNLGDWYNYVRQVIERK